MVNVVIRTGVVLQFVTETGSVVGVFYRNVRTVNSKQIELFDNVGYVEFQIICSNETCLKDICFYHKQFPHS